MNRAERARLPERKETTRIIKDRAQANFDASWNLARAHENDGCTDPECARDIERWWADGCRQWATYLRRQSEGL